MSLCLFWLFEEMLSMQFFWNIQRRVNYLRAIQEFKLSHQTCYNDTKHCWMKSEHRRIQASKHLEPLQVSKMGCFCTNSHRLKVVNWTRKSTLSQMFKGVLNILLLKSKASVRCPKRTIDAPKYNVNVRNIYFEIFQ